MKYLEPICSVCKKEATKIIEVIWKGKKRWFCRCDKHITDKYKGKVLVSKDR